MNGKQIREITAKGLLYVDDNGEEQFIEFSDCYDNHLSRYTNPERLEIIKQVNNFDDEQLAKSIERKKQYKAIGDRQILSPPWGDGPYIEFYTDPPLRFNFDSEDEFSEVRSEIENGGWTTYDCS